MTWKKVNQSDAGTGTKFGGNDVDKISDLFSNVDVDDVRINSDWDFRDGKLGLRNPANTFSYITKGSAIAANRDVTEPLLTANDTRVYQSHTQTLINKTIDTRDNSIISRENSYLIFKDGSTYYARNGITGALTSNTVFATLIQAISDAIATRDDTTFTRIKIAPGDYTVNTVITFNNKYNISIEGSGMGITRFLGGSSLTSDMFQFIGSSSGTAKSLTANGVLKSRSITMSSGDASTFAVNDYVLLRSDVDFARSVIGSSAVSGHQGEIKRIQSISSGTVTFYEPLFDSYATTDGAAMIKLLPGKNLSLSNFTIKPGPSYTNTDDRWIQIRLYDKISVDRIEMIDAPGQFPSYIDFRSCLNAKVVDCHIEQNITYNFQYGFTFSGCCQDCTVTNCTAYGFLRHAFEVGNGEVGTDLEGVCRNIVISNCVATGGGQAMFDTHPEGEGIQFINCGVIGNNSDGTNGNVEAFKLRCPNSSIIGCWAKGINCPSDDGAAAFVVNDYGHYCTIQGCTINDCDGNGILLGAGRHVDSTNVIGCIINNCTRNGIIIKNSCQDTMVSGCRITNSGIDGIDCSDLDNAVISNNIIKNNTGRGIDFTSGNCQNNMIHGNWFGSNTAGNIRNGGQTGNLEADNKGYP